MEISSLLERPIHAIWLYRSEGVHAAWVDKFTLPIVATEAFLEFSDGDLIGVGPCEVQISSNKYPSLGLEFHASQSDALRSHLPNGQVVEAILLDEAAPLMPFTISHIQESDPLGEGAISQYSLHANDGGVITFRHIFPPLTLGICVEATERAPNNSFKPNPLRGSA